MDPNQEPTDEKDSSASKQDCDFYCDNEWIVLTLVATVKVSLE